MKVYSYYNISWKKPSIAVIKGTFTIVKTFLKGLTLENKINKIQLKFILIIHSQLCRLVMYTFKVKHLDTVYETTHSAGLFPVGYADSCCVCSSSL